MLVTRDVEIEGRKYVVQVPDYETDYSRGIVVGPPNLDVLDLSEEITTRLHNELFARRLITKKDIVKRRNEVVAALQYVLGVDADKIMRCYENA